LISKKTLKKVQSGKSGYSKNYGCVNRCCCYPAEKKTSLADVNSLPLAEAVVEAVPNVLSDRWCFERTSERSSSASESSAPVMTRRMVHMTRGERDMFVLSMIYPNNV
jgi:hypothetical protein